MPDETRFEYGSQEYYQNPYPTLKRIQEKRKPVWHEPTGTWLISTYEDVSCILKDASISKQFIRENPSPLERTMLFQDPPNHTRLRSLVSQVFTPRAITEMEKQILDASSSLLARFSERRSMDFIADFTLPLPIQVIAEMLGVPREDWAPVHGHSLTLIKAADGQHSPEESGQLLAQGMMGLIGCFSALIDTRRANPKDDLLSRLIAVHDNDGGLDTDELVGTAILLMIAGHETTVNLLGNGLYLLMQNPESMKLLKDHPELIPGAIEEMLRCESPVQQGTYRRATETIRISGVEIPAGSQITVLFGAANRDPAVFPNPEVFDVRRTPNKHLAFGTGIHFCLGAPLARAEARIAFEMILNRMPGVQLSGSPSTLPRQGLLAKLLGMLRPPDQMGGRCLVHWTANPVVRSLDSLQVEW